MKTVLNTDIVITWYTAYFLFLVWLEWQFLYLHKKQAPIAVRAIGA